MTDSIESMWGVGPAAVRVFRQAGYTKIMHLRDFDGGDRRLWDAITALKPNFPYDDEYWKRLMTRCINIIYRARSAQADPYVPDEFMCQVCFGWYRDPVVTPTGHSYCRRCVVEDNLRYRDKEAQAAANQPLYDNIALGRAVEMYRLNHQKFGIID